MSQGIASRQVALQMVLQLLQQRQTVEEVRALLAGYTELSAQDKAFCMQLVMMSLRHKGALEALIARYMQRPLKASRLDVQCCLMLGAAQLLLMEVPNHAAVDTSVELAKEYQPKMAGLVNAVLKKVAGEGEPAWQALLQETNPAPNWLWQSWVDAYGPEVAQAIAAAHRQEPALDITLKHAGDVSSWAEKLSATPMPGGSLRCSREQGRDITQWPGFESGDWWVQELAASLPVKLMGELNGKTVLDCCAAPGGKTAQLASAGAKVTAVDQSPARMQRLQENMQRLQLEIQAITADLLQWQPDEAYEAYDAILLDAPCSATGTIRRHPELPWIRTEKELKRLVQIQQKLLHRVVKWLKPGGTLLYAVCSLQPEEGERQIAELVKSGKVKLASISAEEAADQPDWLLPDGTVRTLPSHLAGQGGMDGFFIARMRRLA